MTKLFRSILFVVLCLFAANMLQAQIVLDNSKWTFEAKKISGDKYELIVHCKLPDKWHIYALNPGGDGMEIAPEVRFVKNSDVKLIGSVKERGKRISEKMIGIDGNVNIYKNKVDYVQEAIVKSNATIKGTYSYQICDDNQCLPPKRDKPFTINIGDAVGAAATSPAADTADNSKATTDTASPVQTANVSGGADTSKKAVAATTTPSASATVKAKEEKSLLWLFLAALAGGLAAVITPCVYSMIPITVSFFTKRSKTRAEGLRNALYYSLSIIIIFTVLGVLISAIFGANALNALSTNWIANLFFFVIFVIFGISFLGAFEIT